MTVWFTSDTHFGHANIIKYCKRPFGSADEMDRELICNWNNAVANGDTVYHLGDFSFHKDKARTEAILKQLNGEKHLILGNHDRQMDRYRRYFNDIKHYKEIEVEGQKITLMHYAMRVWNKNHHGSWQLHGHSHGSMPRDYKIKQLDVGVDCWNYRPISFAEVSLEMGKHGFTAVDRHGAD